VSSILSGHSLRCRRCAAVRFRPQARRTACSLCGGEVFDSVDTASALAEVCATASDDYTAAEVLFQLRYGGDWGCERCGHRRCTHLRSRPRLFECNACGKSISVTAGTALNRCRLPLVVVLRAAARLSSSVRSISARALARELELTVETAWSLAHRLRAGFLEAHTPRMGPDVVLSPVSVRSRPPWRRRRIGLFPFASITVLWDRSHRVVVTPGRPDPYGTRAFVDRHANVERPVCGRYLLPDRPWDATARTHRGVSDRWMPMYVHAMAGWHNARVERAAGAVETLRVTLRCGRHPFRTLRPAAPPGPYARWDLSFEELEAHSRAWRPD
jgi:hypothetical protein